MATDSFYQGKPTGPKAVRFTQFIATTHAGS